MSIKLSNRGRSNAPARMGDSGGHCTKAVCVVQCACNSVVNVCRLRRRILFASPWRSSSDAHIAWSPESVCDGGLPKGASERPFRTHPLDFIKRLPGNLIYVLLEHTTGIRGVRNSLLPPITPPKVGEEEVGRTTRARVRPAELARGPCGNTLRLTEDRANCNLAPANGRLRPAAMDRDC